MALRPDGRFEGTLVKVTLATILAFYLALLPAGEASARVELDAGEVEAWADAVLGTAFEQRRYSGAVISVVQDGAIVLSKGYGFADYASQQPVDPERTEFRIGSITKTFTATAIAQLLERGLIRSLDDPANSYLKRFQLPASEDSDITLWHLLNHRSGFEDRIAGLAIQEDQPSPVSGDYIKSVTPALVRETGAWSVYDNFGVAVLGIVIEDITGESLADYLEQNIFEPLEMSNTVLAPGTQPSPRLGRPYATFPDGSLKLMPFLGIHPFIAPTGAINSTAADMARYMVAHLSAGRAGNNPILKPGTFATMHTIHARNHPLFGGWGMIFPIRYWDTEKLVEHEGSWPGTSSKMALMTDSNAGVFLSVMGGKGSLTIEEKIASLFGASRNKPNDEQNQSAADFEQQPFVDVSATMNLFLARFIGPYRPAEQVFSSAPLKEELSRYVGSYMDNRTSFSTYEIMDAMVQTLKVEVDGNGGLSILGMDGFKAISPGVFWREGEVPALIGFIEDEDGMHFVVDGISRYFSRRSGVANPANLLAPAPIFLLIIMTGLVAVFWPARHKPGNNIERFSKWLPVAAPLCLAAMFFFLSFGFAPGDSLEIAIGTGRTGRFIGVIAAANLLAAIASAMLLVCFVSWPRGYWGEGKRAILRRIHFTLVTVAAVGMLPALAFANLLGFRIP